MSRWQRICAMPAHAGRSIGRGIAAVTSTVAETFDFRDVMMFGGNGLLGYGLYLIYPPAAFVICGGIFVAIAVFGTR